MTFEKRIGERFLVAGVPVSWETSADAPRRSLRRRGPKSTADLRDVSMSGVGVIAPTEPDLKPGHVVRCQLADGFGFVGRVRRCAPTDQGDRNYFGVEFLEVDPQFQDWLNELLGRERPERTMEIWNRAT